MARIEKKSPLLNLTKYQTFVVDDSPTSQYFKLSEIPNELTAGKNGFLIEGSEFLKPTTEIKIEVLDVEGNPLYVEPGEGIPEYYEGLSKLVSMHVYQTTPIGIGKITILGELDTYVDENGITRSVPEEWKGVYNVKWKKDVKINKNVQNESRIRFIKRPEIIIEEIGESFYSTAVSTLTQTDATVKGYSLIPSENTNLSTYIGGIKYVIEKESGVFEDNIKTISVTNTNIVNAEVIEYLNSKALVIGIPYITSDNVVGSFSNATYSATYEVVTSTVESSVFGSFARFEINNLATFVGDVERIKVYSKSRAAAIDYSLVQDTRVDSANLLTTLISGSSQNVGQFTSSYLGSGKSYTDYWVTQSSSDISLDSVSVYKGVKFRNNKISSFLGDDIRLEKNSEYTLEFWVYYSGSVINPFDTLKVYMTSTEQTSPSTINYYLTESLGTLSGTTIYKFPTKISYNFIAPLTDNWTVNFEAYNLDPSTYWCVGNVSLVGSNELGYSPDEFTFTIPVVRTLEQETFDFKLEYYDINNNYVPIQSNTTKTFISGNIALLGKSAEIEIDTIFFRFDSSSNATPPTQSADIVITKNKFIGSLLITSQAYDTGGFYITPLTYTSFGYAYPGVLSSYTENAYSASGTVTLADFTGALHPNPVVDKIVYTVTDSGSLYPSTKTFTIYRIKDGTDGVPGPPGASGSDGEAGVTGPGIVFTGVWEPNRFYQFSSGSGGRRDVVLWNSTGVGPPYDTYYATLRAHTSDTTGSINTIDGSPSQSLSTGSTWEYLGTQDYFVAAKIAIFEESYVQNTLNIGTNNNGGTSSANITLAGGTQYPYISIGQTPIQGYGYNGIWIGNHSGSYNLSLVSGSSNSLKWNGASGSLLIQGTLSASAIIGGTGDFAGTISASNGNIGGWNIGNNAITSVNASMSIDSNNSSITVYSGSATPSITIRPGDPSAIATISKTITIDAGYEVSTNAMNLASPYSGNNDVYVYGTSNSFTISPGEEGLYTGNIISNTLTGGNALLSLNSYAGLVSLTLSFEIASDAGFANIIYTTSLGSANGPYIESIGIINFIPASSIISVNLSTPATYHWRLRWRLRTQSTVGSVTVLSKTSNVDNFDLNLATSITEITDGAIQVVRDSDYYVKIKRTGNETNILQVGGDITATGNITAYYSDKRLKTILGNIPKPLEKIEKLNGVYYTQNKLAEQFGYKNYNTQVGLIAQEVEEVLPQVVTLAPFDNEGGKSKSGENYLTLHYEKIVPLLVECIKELKAEIELLKNKK